MTHPQEKPEKKSWEEEFDKRFLIMVDTILTPKIKSYPILNVRKPDKIKSFISSLLKSELQKMIEETRVEERALDTRKSLAENSYFTGHNSALQEIARRQREYLEGL